MLSINLHSLSRFLLTDSDNGDITSSSHVALATGDEVNENTRNQSQPIHESTFIDYRYNDLYLYQPCEEEIPFKCLIPQCTSLCMNLKGLKKHYINKHLLSEHEEDLPLKCYFCDCTFLRKIEYKGHLEKHLEESAFACTDFERKYFSKIK